MSILENTYKIEKCPDPRELQCSILSDVGDVDRIALFDVFSFFVEQNI